MFCNRAVLCTVGVRQGKRVVPADSQYTNYYSFARFGLRFQNQKPDHAYHYGNEAEYMPSSAVPAVSEAAGLSQIPLSLFSHAVLSQHDSIRSEICPNASGKLEDNENEANNVTNSTSPRAPQSNRNLISPLLGFSAAGNECTDLKTISNRESSVTNTETSSVLRVQGGSNQELFLLGQEPACVVPVDIVDYNESSGRNVEENDGTRKG
jgi:hypothetical protein